MTLDLTAPIASWLPTAWYGGYVADLPDLCVGRWPPELARATGQRWKVWVVETPLERADLLAALARPVPRKGAAVDFSSGPDAAGSALHPQGGLLAPILFRPSARVANRVAGGGHVGGEVAQKQNAHPAVRPSGRLGRAV